MNPALTAVAVAVGAGAIAAVSSRDPRAALLGLAVVLVGSAFLVDPLPSPATLGVRVVAGLLCISIIRLAAIEFVEEGAGSPLGWPSEGLLAVAAALGGGGIGLGLAVAGSAGSNASLADLVRANLGAPAIVILSAAAAVLAVGATPALLGRPGFGRTVGIVLITVGVTLLLVGFAGAPNDLEQIAIAGLLVGGAASGVGLAHAAAASKSAGAAGAEPGPKRQGPSRGRNPDPTA